MEKISVPLQLQELVEPHFIPGFNREVRNYQIEEPIGSGGEAVVFRGYDTKQRDEPVAVKVSPASTPEQAQRLRAEADIIKAVHDHPGIVKTHWHSTYVQTLRPTGRFGQKQKIIRNYPYAVMEFMDGGTLDTRMRTSILSTREIVSVLGQVLSAVSWIHGEGQTRVRVIHRDIKPSNVLFTSKEPAPLLPGFPDLGFVGCAKISDLGIAIEAPGRMVPGEPTMTATQVGAGTFNYMSPEQVNLKARRQSDDYAIAVMTYRLITGRFPIVLNEADLQNQSPVMCWAEKAQNDANLTPLSEANPERMDKVLEELEPIIMKSLRANWQERYPQTGDFQEAVRLAVHKGLAAHRQDKRYFDIAAPQPGSYRPQPEPEGWPQAPKLSLGNPIAQEVIPRMATEPIPRPPEPEPIPSTPSVPMNRRRFLRSVGLLSTIGALTTTISGSEAPKAPEVSSPPDSPETLAAARQVIADAAKEVIRTLEARNLKQNIPFILKHLVSYDQQYVLDKTLQMQADGNSEAAWLAIEMASFSPAAIAEILKTYTERSQYTEMAIVGSTLNMVAESLMHSPVTTNPYPEVNEAVENAISACQAGQRLDDASTIAAATHSGTFELSGYPVGAATTTQQLLDNLRSHASSDPILFNNLRALGTAVAFPFGSVVSEVVKRYSQGPEPSSELAAYVYPLMWHLSVAVALYDKIGGSVLQTMAVSNSGIAGETTWPFAIELAPYNPDAVEEYIKGRSPMQIPYMAAAALAGKKPALAESLRATASPRYQKWIDAALNPTDGHSVARAVKDLTNGPDSNVLETLGAELTAALLISHKAI